MTVDRERRTVGRPKVTERPGFPARFWQLVPLVESGEMSKRQAAKRLGIGIATLLRLLADPAQVPREDEIAAQR